MGSQVQIKNHFKHALESNHEWCSYKSRQNPTFFQKAEAGQSPTILWLGCSDSRVPETTILGLQPGEVFVHRNIANIISPTDINSMAVIEYAVQHLKVSHIILCGHTRCGGAAAALSDERVGGVIDTWITPLRMLRRDNTDKLDLIKDDKEKAVKLAELGVEMGVRNLMNNYCVIQAIEERGLRVHGCIYDVASGRIRDLNCGSCPEEETQPVEEPPSKESYESCLELMLPTGENICGSCDESNSPVREQQDILTGMSDIEFDESRFLLSYEFTYRS